MSELLRRWTRNPLGSARRDSNPLGVDWFEAGVRVGEEWKRMGSVLVREEKAKKKRGKKARIAQSTCVGDNEDQLQRSNRRHCVRVAKEMN